MQYVTLYLVTIFISKNKFTNKQKTDVFILVISKIRKTNVLQKQNRHDMFKKFSDNFNNPTFELSIVGQNGSNSDQ